MHPTHATGEALVIADPRHVHDLRQVLPATVTLRHAASPHVAVIAGPAPALAALATLAGITLVSADQRPDMTGLAEADVLFVEAWLSRQQPPVTRAGDGLSWDAPGFTPPDPPHDD